MKLNYTCRLATKEDAVRIIELVQMILPEFGLVFSPENSEADLINFENYYLQSGGVFLLLEDEQHNLIGTAGLAKINDELAKLRKMYVHPACRGLGLGELLVQQLLQYAQKMNFHRIRLDTYHAMTSAIKLYKKYGFTEIDDPATSVRCDIVMELVLPSNR